MLNLLVQGVKLTGIFQREVSGMELKEAIQTGKNLAEYFVFICGEGEHYVALIERLRAVTSRSGLLEAVNILMHYGRSHLNQELESLKQQSIDFLFQFIREGDKSEVSRFYSSLITNIANFEVEKIQEQERYLYELLLSGWGSD